MRIAKKFNHKLSVVEKTDEKKISVLDIMFVLTFIFLVVVFIYIVQDYNNQIKMLVQSNEELIASMKVLKQECIDLKFNLDKVQSQSSITKVIPPKNN